MMEALRRCLKSLGSLKGRAVVAAVSGGADSVCLLLALAQLRIEFGYDVEAVHCNHGLRGREADADERFVRALCAKLGLKLRVYRARLRKGSAVEERGRDFRRRCFAKACAASSKRARFVFLAHHAGDQAETLLMNLARGAGLSGAGAMRPVAALEGASRIKIVRPWLEVDPRLLRAELKRRGQAWREDKSNADTNLNRNALRKKVLPQLEKMLPGASLRMAAFSRRVAEAASALESLIKRELTELRFGKGWDIRALREKEPGLRRLLLKAMGGKWMDEAAIFRAEALVLKGSGRADLRGKTYLIASRNRLLLRKE